MFKCHIGIASRRLFLPAVAAAVRVLLGGAFQTAPAQQRSSIARSTASLSGRVVVRSTGVGIPGAQVALETGPAPTIMVRTDSAGHYALVNVPTGTLHVLVRALGYQPSPLVLNAKAGDELDVEIPLDSTVAPTLPAVDVTASAPTVSYRLRDFERRRRLKMGGQFLTEDEIRASTAANLQDLTRGMRGVTLNCGGTLEGGCRIQMVGAPQNCQPDYYIDGRIDNMFGQYTPIRDIVALEVYTGASDVPGEFAGRTAGCGVIAVWTRSAPPRRRP